MKLLYSGCIDIEVIKQHLSDLYYSVVSEFQ
jgi:hypothetical protein